MGADAIETFRCVPLSCALTPRSCGRRHLEAVPFVNAVGQMRPLSSTCRSCSVGAAHARGERPDRWPDGSPIVFLGTFPRPTIPIETSMPKKRNITWNGRTQTVGAWAAELGTTSTTIAARDRSGRPLDGSDVAEKKADAGAPKPVAKPKPKAAAKKPAPAPAAEPADIDGPALLGIAGISHELVGRTPRGLLVLIHDASVTAA